jgi:hypothetical protein
LLIGAEKLDIPEIAAPSTGAANTAEVLTLSAIAANAANILIFMNLPRFGADEGNRTLVFSLEESKLNISTASENFLPAMTRQKARLFSDNICAEFRKGAFRPKASAFRLEGY